MPITTTPSGGPQGEFSTYTPISAQTLSSAVSSVTFSNIPTTFTDLVIVVNGFTSYSASADAYQLSFNGATTNLSATRLFGNGSSPLSDRYGTPYAGWISTTRGADVINIMNYSNTTTYKTAITKSSSQGSYPIAGATAVLWQSTSAITSVTISDTSGNWQIGSTFSLYGIKAATTPPKGLGGDIIVTDGTYWYHGFKNTALFTPTVALTADILSVAGGGAGGGGIGGGGGAGGYVYSTSQSLTALSGYTCTVGAGGYSLTYLIASTSGNNTQFGSLTAAVGGGYGGGRVPNYPGATGGSGGGGAGTSSGGNRTGGSATSGQGNAGGAGNGGTSGLSTGGGGGAGAAGSGGTDAGPGGASSGGAGGAGINTYATLVNAVGFGVNGYICGGGGGAAASLGYGGSGGSGGGGGGSNGNTTPSAGTAYSGGGGGGGGNDDTNPYRYMNGAKGGSGFVIVRYPV